MLRLWGKLIKRNKIVRHMEAVADNTGSYQEELKKCITEICYTFDIQKPYWLPKNLEEYNKYKRTSFNQDNFIEEIVFDKLEIEVIEEK